MPVLHFIGGEKGGVGKSVLSRLLAQYYIDQQKPFQAFDADQSHGAMLRYYADFSEAVDPTDIESLDTIAETAAESGNDVIIDLAAQTSRPLYRWMDECGVSGLGEELGLTLVMWHVMDDGSDSQKLLQGLLDAYGNNVQYVIVRNHGRGKDFSRFNASAEKQQAESLGAAFIDLPALNAGTMRKIDHHSASFWAAANSSDALGLMDRQRCKVWIRKAYAQIESVLPQQGKDVADSHSDAEHTD